MPAESIIVVTFVSAMFALFMAVLGGVWIWSNLPDAAPARAKAKTPARTDAVAAH